MFEPEELMVRIVGLEEQLKVSEMAHQVAEQLISCLEGEIAKRDEELAACRVAVENCEAFRARIAELERQLNSDKLIKMVTELREELAAIKAQGVVIDADDLAQFIREIDGNHKMGAGVLAEHIAARLNAAPAAPAADGVVVPHELLMRVLEPVTSEQYLNSKHELCALMDTHRSKGWCDGQDEYSQRTSAGSGHLRWIASASRGVCANEALQRRFPGQRPAQGQQSEQVALMHLTSHHHGFLRYLTEWQAAEIYRRRQMCLRATRKAVAVSDSAIARKFELDRTTVARYIARPGTGGDDGRLIRAMVDGRDNLLATAKRHTLQALADDYGVPISVIFAASEPEIWSEEE